MFERASSKKRRLVARLRASACAGLLGTVLAFAAIPSAGISGRAAAATGGRDSAESRTKLLQIFYRSPVLVRAGERVRIPVDVVCATAAGTACAATVSLGTAGPDGTWRHTTVRSQPGLQFDLTAPARRAAAAGASGGELAFDLRARASDGTTASTPATGTLRVYVATHMARIAATGDETRQGTVALFLPWGTGPMRAGLALGNESATGGPSAFDVDQDGRIFLMDSLQQRVAVFGGSRLVRQIPTAVLPRADVAVGSDGGVFVGTGDAAAHDQIVVRRYGRAGAPSTFSVGTGILSELRVEGTAPFAHLLPLDAWVPAAVSGTAASRASTGLRLGGGGLLLKSVVGNTVRIGRVSASGTIESAFEIDPSQPIGELALGADDGDGGFVAVFRLLQSTPGPDHYEVVHIAADGTSTSFQVDGDAYAETLPLSRFRLGGDGKLYQLTSSPDGIRILRYEIGGTA